MYKSNGNKQTAIQIYSHTCHRLPGRHLHQAYWPDRALPPCSEMERDITEAMRASDYNEMMMAWINEAGRHKPR